MSQAPTKKDLWKATQLEYLHNCFIGISHLTCSNPDCPLVLNWGDIEKKQSKKGKCAFYLVSQKENKWVVVDLEKFEENDLGTYENIEIKFKSGKIQRTKPTSHQETQKQQPILSSGVVEKETKKEIFLKPEEIILFFNNSTKRPNLEDAETIYLEELWDIKEKIKWDRDKSKKKVFLRCENDPSDTTKAEKITASEDDYLFYVANPDITNEIKEMQIHSPGKGTEERKQLHADYEQELSELKEVYGIRHNIQAKEERQNNPEIDMVKSPFLALERDKWRERMKSIKDFENKKGCAGKHTLSYGSYQEHQQEMIIQQQIENQEEENQQAEKAEEKPAETLKEAAVLTKEK